ncbi:MAG: hypothetical protein NTX81_01375 [Candidatus Bathyarchaeota archaeon]|nr:hypothetical protein [Candidatus Bathyarchaeota archaeon]
MTPEQEMRLIAECMGTQYGVAIIAICDRKIEEVKNSLLQCGETSVKRLQQSGKAWQSIKNTFTNAGMIVKLADNQSSTDGDIESRR